MKRIVKLFLCLLLVIPVFIKAYTITNYNDSISYTNTYINKYTDKNKYLLFNAPYDFKNGKAIADTNDEYTTGGLLSYDEYNTSKSKNSSYLSAGKGRDYWTITSLSGTQQYYVENGILGKNVNDVSGIRVTEFVKPEVRVDGKGTYNNPWVFRDQYSVQVRVENSQHGSVSPSYAMVDSGSKFRFVITDKRGYEYNTSDCVLSKYANPNKYETTPITQDTICTLSFNKRFININYACTGGSGEVSPQIVEYGTDYSLADYLCTKKGYTQTKWETSDGNKWTKGLQGKFEVENGDRGLVKNKLDLKPEWTAKIYKVVYKGNGGTWKNTDSWTETSSPVFNKNYTVQANFYTRTGYTFAGWKDTTGVSWTDWSGKWVYDNGEYGITNNTLELIAQWTPNTYSMAYTLDGGSNGTKKPTSGTYDTSVEIDNPSKSVTAKFSVASGITASSTKDITASYTFQGWDISKMDTVTHTFGTTTSTSTTATGIKATSFKNLRSTAGEVAFSAKWKAPSITLPTITKSGYTCKWISDSWEWASGGKYSPNDSGGATSRTFTASCSPATLTVYLCRNNVSHAWCVNDLKADGGCDKAFTSLHDSKGNYVAFTTGKNNWVVVYPGLDSNNRYKVKSIGGNQIYNFDHKRISDYDGKYWIDSGCVKNTTTDYDCLYTTCPNDY